MDSVFFFIIRIYIFYNFPLKYVNFLFVLSIGFLARLNEFVQNDPAYCPRNCGRSYKGKWRKTNLRNHLVYECGLPCMFKCHICNRTFKHKCTLKSHMGCKHKIVIGKDCMNRMSNEF